MLRIRLNSVRYTFCCSSLIALLRRLLICCSYLCVYGDYGRSVVVVVDSGNSLECACVYVCVNANPNIANCANLSIINWVAPVLRCVLGGALCVCVCKVKELSCMVT